VKRVERVGGASLKNCAWTLSTVVAITGDKWAEFGPSAEAKRGSREETEGSPKAALTWGFPYLGR
jgi:hypothetical protein